MMKVVNNKSWFVARFNVTHLDCYTSSVSDLASCLKCGDHHFLT